MHNANREVRHSIIELIDKYPVEYISNSLSLEYINSAFNDIRVLRQKAIDATPDLYRYINLIYKSLHFLQKNYQIYKEDFPHNNYCETLASWLNLQLKKAYDYSKSIGTLPT